MSDPGRTIRPMTVQEMAPRGHYLAAEVGRLAGVSGTTIGQWARRGYIRSSQSDGPPRGYSYQDIAEAMVVHALLERGLAHAAIRAAVAFLRERHGYNWPLSHTFLLVPADYSTATDSQRTSDRGRAIAARMDGGIIDVTTGDTVLEESDLLEIAADLRRGGWAARHSDLSHIEVNPDRLSGRPVIAGTRIPAEDVARLAATPDGDAILRTDYGLDPEQIADARTWWAAVTRYEPAAA